LRYDALLKLLIHEAEGVAIEIGKTRARNVGKAAHLLELD
jgi:hypothetical protein